MSDWVPGVGPLWWERPEVRFPLQFGVLCGVVAAGWVALTPAWPSLTTATAEMVAWAARASGLGSVAEPGAQVAFSDGAKAFEVTIIPACTGVMLLMIYAAAVLAFPATREQRMLGLAIGLPALFVANLLRLVALAWAGLYAPAQFEELHQYWAQALMIALAGVTWFGWAWLVAGAKRRTPAAGSRSTTMRLTLAARSVRVRRQVAQVGAFCGALVVCGILGLAAHGIEVWSRLTNAPVAHAAPLFDVYLTPPPSGAEVLGAYGLAYSALAAVVALFLITPGIPWRARIQGALLTGIPAVYLIQVAIALMVVIAVDTFKESADIVVGPFLRALTLPLSIGIPAILWHRSLHRTSDLDH